MSNIFSFPQQLYRFNLGAKKKRLEPVLHVKYFQFSTATVQIQPAGKKKLKDRITPHVTNFFTLRLSIEKQEGKRKYKSDGAVMVGEFVCVCMCMYSQ